MNLFADIPQDLPEELFSEIFKNESLRIERIVSKGHSSDPDFWYEQDEHEWVIVLQGEAELEYADGAVKRLQPGDYVLIPAVCKHRVKSSSVEPRCIWLALFFKGDLNG